MIKEPSANTKLIPLPKGLPPKMTPEVKAIHVTDELASIFVPRLGLGADLPEAKCYIGDIVDGDEFISKFIVIVASNGINYMAIDWDRYGLWVGYLLGKFCREDNLTPNEMLAITVEFLSLALAAGKTESK